ncbi:hypothetical protein [Hyphomicrobium sp. DY-1]|uniref:hypothetical protein n=1 Tax=Hyphomicrobium sp. DY-1 TaxID=3075650 RepID=UPI0039C26111
MTTRIDLINECLVLNGSAPLINESAPGAETHIACFNRATELILSCHPWNCNSYIRQLNRKTDPPEPAHWLYAFELPTELIGAPRAFYPSSECRQPTTTFELMATREVRTNHETLWVRGPWNVEPTYWPGYLREVIMLLVRSELALSTREDRALRDSLRNDAIGNGLSLMQGGLLGQARALDDMAKPSPVIAQYNNPLIAARTGSYGGPR